MRGKGSRKYLGMVNLRITPAHAGKSPELLHVIIVQWDHPRVCGEKPTGNNAEAAAGGSPPRMRGKADEWIK